MGLTQPTTQARGQTGQTVVKTPVPSPAGAMCVKQEAYLTPAPVLAQGPLLRSSFSASSHLSVPPNTGAPHKGPHVSAPTWPRLQKTQREMEEEAESPEDGFHLHATGCVHDPSR